MLSFFSKQKAQGSSKGRKTVRQKRSFKPLLEVLEDRTLLSIAAGPIVNPANGHTYYLLTQSRWTAAEAEAISLGGHLATINEVAEDNWVFDTFNRPGQYGLWIGLNDVATEGNFVWSSGEPAPYRNWSGGQPDNYLGREDHGMIFVEGHGWPSRKWNDFWDTDVEDHAPGIPFGILQGVVEVPTQPDLVASSLTWNTAQSGVDFGYRVSGANLTQDTTAALYWASGPTFAARIGGPVYDTLIERPQGNHGPFYVPNAVLGTPPPAATHLLLVVDPPSTGSPKCLWRSLGKCPGRSHTPAPGR
jgi:hypothetical protein